MTIGIFFLIFFTLIVVGTPIAVVFGAMAALPKILNNSFPYTIEAAIRSMVSGLDSFTLLAVPLFMLSGIIMARGGISKKLFNFFAYFIGNKTAGMPCAVIITCMFYGAISGSSPATVSAVGSMTIPFLITLGYDKVFSTALVTVAGGLGVIIPPSISYIVYSSASNASPSALFIGGIFPGMLIGLALMICAYIHCKKNGEDKNILKENYEKIKKIGFYPLFKESFFALLTPIIILGSIYGGVASPTEAAAISVLYSLIICIFVYKTLRIKDLWAIIVEGSKTYITILFIIAAATAFGRAITLLRYPQVINGSILGNISNKILILFIINAILLVFGMFLDNIPNIMILTPIFLPIIKDIGMDPVHFGIMMTANLAIGMVTPPMGINLFVASSMTQVPVLKIAKASIPFLIAFFIALLLIVFIPQISLFLPSLL
ncbi:MAG: TRAP transporter large permease [Fusobacteriaceae bacterium]|jgi:C4-dicarboxylate transporter DctM subunit|nr:TRAP transporter large permease [Fusobacteriaceae bacterium]